MPGLVSPECPVTPESVFFRSGALRMHALRWSGPGGRDLVVVPGITTPAASAGSFAWRLAALPGVGDVYVLDTRGRGLSEKSPVGTHAVSDYAADVLALIDERGLDRPVLIGHSLGGRVVAHARVQCPGASYAAVVIDPPMSGPGLPAYPIPLDRMLNGVLSARQGRGREDAAALNPHWGPEQVAERGDWLGETDESAVVEGFARFHLEAFEPLWRTVPAPVLLMVGDRSPVVPAETADMLVSLNPAASLVPVSGCGHMVPMDNPDETVAEIRSFLATLI